MNTIKNLVFVVLASATIFTLTTRAQTTVNMKIPLQSKEALNVSALFNSPTQAGTSVLLTHSNFRITGGSPPYTFTWLKDNQVFATGNAVEFTFLSSSSYALKVSDQSRCNSTATIDIKPTSIGNKEYMSGLVDISPTLIKDHFDVRFNNHNVKTAIVKIVDVSGVLRQKVDISGDATIPVNLTSGLYIVIVEWDKFTIGKKLIIQ